MSRNEISININDHGTALDDHKRRVKCNYCGKVVSGFTRLKCHLGGIRGDVAPCGEVPTDVMGLMRNKLLEKKRGNLSKEVGELYHPDLPWKRNWCPQSSGVKDAEQDMVQPVESGGKKHVKFNSISENSVPEVFSFPKGNICSQTTPSAMEELSLHQFQKCIARFFYETGIDFSAAKSSSFQRMVNATLDCGHIEFRIPSCRELKGWILQDEVKEMQQYVNEIRNSWASTGCSILLDGWIDEKGRNLISILVDCPQGPIYLRSLDISGALGNINALQQLFDEVIMEVGADNVIQIITYSTSACMEAVGKQLMEKHRTFFWTVSASHCLELMLEKMGMMDLIKGILEKAKTITKFVYSRATVLKLMRNHTCGCDLVKPSKIRSAMPFLTLENIVSEKENLGKMFGSSEWSTSIWASSREGKEVTDLVADCSFWTGATVVLKATIPLVRVLYLIHEDDKPLLGYIYETIDQAKETIKDEFKNKKAQYTPFWNAIDEIWNNHLHSPLHSAGYFLNPSLFYSSDFFTDAEVASGLLCCIVRMVEGKHVQDLVSLQVDEYRAANGHFGQGSTFDRRSSTSPALWWSRYGGQCPELQRLAIRILSQTCDGASRYQLKRSLAEKLLTKGRNYIEQQRLNDLTFVHYNLQLRNFESGVSSDILAEDIDPMDDWIVDEAQDHVVLENCEPTWMELDKTTTSRVHIEAGSSSFLPKEEPS
ncbi:Flagellin [Actinidia chinensis var. chinensis]|uniref:Flagellin n=1 Tax=Actinidia chinensis var. chinensis TaxID=1590841 RepID=A0A2R6R0Q1_ACTCC|nr:Flagellin [Actinidia chinensis var. chinensis]